MKGFAAGILILPLNGMSPLTKIAMVRDSQRREPIVAALVSLARDSAIYMTGGLLIGLGNVVLVPLYTHSLAPSEFGVYALADVTILLVVTISLLKIDVSYLKWFADMDFARHGELLGSTLLAVLIVSSLSGLGLSLFVVSRAGGFWLHSSGQSYAWLLCPIVVLESLQALFLTDLRARRRAMFYSTCAILRLASMVVASYYLLVIRREGLQGLFLGRLLGDATAIVFLLGVSLPSIAWRFSLSLLRPMLRFGLPLIWSVFAVMFQDASGRYFLGRYGTLDQVGLLGVAIKLGAVFQMLIGQPFGVAWGGVQFQIAKEHNAQVIYSKIFGYVYVFALGSSVIIAIFAQTLFRVFTAPAYYAAIAILPPVLLVRAMSVIEQPASTGIYLAGHTKLLGASYTAALAANLVLLPLLGFRFGLIGVSWAWFLASLIPPILFLFFGQRLYPLSFSAKLIALPLLPWALVLFRSHTNLTARVMDHFAVQCLLGFTIAVGVGLLIARDLQALKRRLGPENPALEVYSR